MVLGFFFLIFSFENPYQIFKFSFDLVQENKIEVHKIKINQ